MAYDPDALKGEGEATLAVSGSFDALLSDISDEIKETEAVEIYKKIAEDELRRHGAWLKSETHRDELSRLENRSDFYKGGRYYYIVTGNTDGQTKWVQDTARLKDEEDAVIVRKNKVENAITGDRYEHESFPLDDEVLLNEDRWTLAAKAGSRYMPNVFDKEPHSPSELIQNMIEARNRHLLGKENPGGLRPGARELLDGFTGYHRIAFGIGVAALETEDIAIAARAFAFGESIQNMPEHVVSRVKALLEVLPLDKRKEFVLAYKNEQKTFENIRMEVQKADAELDAKILKGGTILMLEKTDW